MEKVVERLRLLDYEEAGREDRNKSLLHISPTHFAFTPVSDDPNVSKTLFDDLCKVCNFLFLRIYEASDRGNEQGPVEIDDFDTPSNRVNTIMMECRNLGFEAHFSVYRLTKQAGGAEACALLDFLTAFALQQRGFKFVTPAFQEEEVSILLGLMIL